MRNLLNCLSLILLLGISAASVQAVTYKWLDEEGNTIYSDTPRPGAEEIPEREVQTYSAPRLPAASNTTPKPERQAPEYKSVAITSPQHDAVIQDNTGNVSVSVQVRPALSYAFGHKMVLQVNGNPYSEPVSATSVQLENLARGSYQLQAVIVDKQGKPVIRSNPITIHLKRHFKKP